MTDAPCIIISAPAVAESCLSTAAMTFGHSLNWAAIHGHRHPYKVGLAALQRQQYLAELLGQKKRA